MLRQWGATPIRKLAHEPSSPAFVWTAALAACGAPVRRQPRPSGKACALLRALPFARPTESAVKTSGFGVRMDPFTHGPALHAGLDFAGAAMTPVEATGPVKGVRLVPDGGDLTFTERDGRVAFTVPELRGYQMVEIAY